MPRPVTTPGGGRSHARRRFDLAGIACQRCGARPARQRHHVDRDPQNNDPANVEMLCVPCHRAEHPGPDSCPNGHPYSPENTYLAPGPRLHRRCRACDAEKQRARRAQRKGRPG